MPSCADGSVTPARALPRSTAVGCAAPPRASAPRRCRAMVVAGDARPFVGRDAELAALRAELARVRSGRSRVVLVEGPPGIGKTAMIDRFLADEPDLTLLRATGEQWEAFVAYGVVDQLMRVAGVSNARL